MSRRDYISERAKEILRLEDEVPKITDPLQGDSEMISKLLKDGQKLIASLLLTKVDRLRSPWIQLK